MVTRKPLAHGGARLCCGARPLRAAHPRGAALPFAAALPLAAALASAVAFASAPRAAAAQLPPGVTRDPATAQLDYRAVDAFAEAFRRLPAARDTAAFLDTAYVARAGVGFAVYTGLYDVTAAAVSAAIDSDPGRFRRTALVAPVAVRRLEPEIRAAFVRLRDRYEPAIFPPVFFLVGRHHAGGAVQREGILIAVETYADDARSPAPDSAAPAGDLSGPGADGRRFAGLVPLVAHELVHYQQAASDVEAYQAATYLLARAIKEGVADYVAELLTGGNINAAAHAYGAEHEWELWARFRCEMEGTDTGDWFFRRPANPEWPQDLGYFVGYRIAALRYARGPDPSAALATLLQVDDYRAFLARSGYEEHLARTTGPFPAC